MILWACVCVKQNSIAQILCLQMAWSGYEKKLAAVRQAAFHHQNNPKILLRFPQSPVLGADELFDCPTAL